MKYKVYIDGQVGTTGLQLRQKLQNHADVEILLISEELRKDEAERKRLMNEADVVFLCLPEGEYTVAYPDLCTLFNRAHGGNSACTVFFSCILNATCNEQANNINRKPEPRVDAEKDLQING